MIMTMMTMMMTFLRTDHIAVTSEFHYFYYAQNLLKNTYSGHVSRLFFCSKLVGSRRSHEIWTLLDKS